MKIRKGSSGTTHQGRNPPSFAVWCLTQEVHFVDTPVSVPKEDSKQDEDDFCCPPDCACCHVRDW